MKQRISIIVLLLAFFAAGYLLRGGSRHAPAPDAGTASSATVTEWTCSMHPQIRQPQFGLCPLCGMDLIPVTEESGAGDLGPREIALSAAARKLARVATAPVERRSLAAEIRMVGKLAYDETRFRDITLLSDGQVRRLFINYDGVPVREGDHLAEIYSPEVFAASRELIVAARSAADEQVLRAARQKLRLLGVSEPQIEAMLASGVAADSYVLFSPISGFATRIEVNEGGWMERGGRLATVVDTSTLWARLDAYEKDAAFLHYGQQATLSVEALPGREVAGFVAFIPPEMNEATRTLQVRLNVPNPDGQLKPGMFVRAQLTATLRADGREIAPALADRWICPMHPEIVRDAAAACPICGMALVTAESLGFVAGGDPEPPLTVPASAPLITGRRAVVYVADPEREGVYEGREVELGSRMGDFYVVRDGLHEGDAVVVQGALQIDSAVQILAKPSMMNHDVEAPATTPEPGVLEVPTAVAARLLPHYLDLQEALAADDAAAAQGALRAAMEVTGHHGALADLVHAMLGADALNGMRRPHFETLSNALIGAVHRDPAAFVTPLYLMHCPMVYDDRGADWLQRTATLANPYFGAAMLRCGTLKETITPPPAAPAGAHHHGS